MPLMRRVEAQIFELALRIVFAPLADETLWPGFAVVLSPFPISGLPPS
jgi:hypothetical protein